MEWSPKQDQALKTVDEWLKGGEETGQVFRLFGYAGSGKTTLAKHFAQNVKGQVLFGAFTGKAAYVLQQKGCPASTIHQMIYHTRDKAATKLKDLESQLVQIKQELGKSGLDQPTILNHKKVKDLQRKINEETSNVSRPSFTLNTDSEVKRSELVVIDECSMVDEQMGEDLLSFGTKVLVLGDPAQLPPIFGAGFFTDAQPDFMLDEIHRQASGNPIIDLATRARLSQPLPLGHYGESSVISINEINRDIVLGANQLLVGKNKTRYSYNQRVRELLGYTSALPQPKDRLVCLRNNHTVGLLNGGLWVVEKVYHADNSTVTMLVQGEDEGTKLEVTCHSHHFLGVGDKIPWWDRKSAEEFDFGYALTCHKAQGSQWGNVVVFDESRSFREDRHRWLYTAITRAAEKLTLVNMG